MKTDLQGKNSDENDNEKNIENYPDGLFTLQKKKKKKKKKEKKKKKKKKKEKKKKKLYLPGGSFIQSKEKKVNKIEHLKDFQLQIKECKF